MLDPTQLRTDDNWRGKTSADERRKIQNRLNQRTWRTCPSSLEMTQSEHV